MIDVPRDFKTYIHKLKKELITDPDKFAPIYPFIHDPTPYKDSPETKLRRKILARYYRKTHPYRTWKPEQKQKWNTYMREYNRRRKLK